MKNFYKTSDKQILPDNYIDYGKYKITKFKTGSRCCTSGPHDANRKINIFCDVMLNRPVGIAVSKEYIVSISRFEQ